MYTPKHFAVEDREELLRFIGRHPFGILVSAVRGKPVATHVPFVVLDADAFVLGAHVARANDQWKELDGGEVLAIFQGPHGMVSASWYAQPRQSVPTWNYSAVHCNGQARIVSAERTRQILEAMVQALERGWTIQDADAEYIARMERGIVGIEIGVASVTGTYKYSQNRSAEDRERVIQALGDGALAQAMGAAAETDTRARSR
jgi:transcriptional regulator